MSNRDIRTTFGKLPVYGKILVGLAVLFLVITGGYYAIIRFSSSTIYSNTHSNSSYEWTGGNLALQNDSKTNDVYCSITPKGGASQSELVPTQLAKSYVSTRITQVEPWFTGAADVTCNGTVSAWQGGSASQWSFISSVWYKVLAIVLILLPLIAFIVIGAARRKRTGQPPSGTADPGQ